ncbi:MAG: ABC transporter permease [Heliobacteriaceae bacterium]|nr:ABC transporter permease [Heliobacteriaceae bacterium]MDD4588465.1 ABC transporter permease [Heliobacteriaceae bacterium]
MLRYIARRLVLMLAVAFGVSFVTFFLMYLAPGEPAEMIAITRYGAENLTAEQVAVIRLAEGLDQPVYLQFGRWLGHVLQGDLGVSLISGEPVLTEILARFPATLQLAVAAMAVSLLIALPAGVIAALKQHSAVDYFTMTGALLGVSMPNFWLGLLLMLLFAVNLGWFPVSGYGGWRNIVLPAITLGTGIAAVTARLTRSSMLEVLAQDYMLTARAKGLGEGRIIAGHALKNALIPVVTMVGLQFGHLLEGAVVVETVFAWPGVGKLLVDAIFARDYALLQGCVLIFAGCFVLVNLVVDLIYVWLDPRIRYEKGG